MILVASSALVEELRESLRPILEQISVGVQEVKGAVESFNRISTVLSIIMIAFVIFQMLFLFVQTYRGGTAEK